MALSSEQVLQSLMSYYKSRGIDMTFLLGDPIFVSQPLEAKVDFVRSKAAELAAGVRPGLTGSERAMVSGGALVGTFSGLLAARSGLVNKVVNSKPSMAAYLVTAGLGAVSGAMLGSMAGGVGAYRARDDRLSTGRELSAIHKDPSDANILGALSMGAKPGRFGPGLKDLLLGKVDDRIRSIGYEGHIGGRSPGLFDTLHESYQHEFQ